MQGSLLRFLGFGLVGYLLWYVAYQYFLKDSTLLDEWLIHSMVLSVESVLRWMGFALYEVSTADFRWQLGIANSVGMLEIGAPCDGLVLFALFAVFVLAFPGPWRRKAWFIPAGIVAIHVANLLRVLSLVIINFYRPEALTFNHDYTWTVLIFGFIFWLWYLWTEWFSRTAQTAGS
jgi:exosortase family protein XrtF